ncbi:hypothetical protein EIP91_003852 [Steccherinum ochraceum]|uniref:Uncharacterized protein n=1 Tax=Steccherinum ochraceum TaxID=92696 RepID=A0A4R0RLD4_9APHY|nr:hypothetical protein EIP91_003852 [Steccherinum ochraceum]
MAQHSNSHFRHIRPRPPLAPPRIPDNSLWPSSPLILQQPTPISSVAGRDTPSPIISNPDNDVQWISRSSHNSNTIVPPLQVQENAENIVARQAWTVRHPDFRANGGEDVENFKHNGPCARASTPLANAPTSFGMPAATEAGPQQEVEQSMHSIGEMAVKVLQQQLDGMARAQEDMAAYIRGLEGTLHRMMADATQEMRLMQGVLQYLLEVDKENLEQAQRSSRTSSPRYMHPAPFAAKPHARPRSSMPGGCFDRHDMFVRSQVPEFGMASRSSYGSTSPTSSFAGSLATPS